MPYAACRVVRQVRLPPLVTKKAQQNDDDDDDDDEPHGGKAQQAPQPSARCAHACGARDARETARQVEETMTAEEWIAGEDASRKLQLTMEDVLAIQTMFARSFPLHPELNRVSEEDIVLGIAEITSLPFAALIRTICVFLHRTVAPPPILHAHALVSARALTRAARLRARR